MTEGIQRGEHYGEFETVIIKEISFEKCQTKLPLSQADIINKLRNLLGSENLVTELGRSIVDGKEYTLHSMETSHYGKEYEIIFTVEVRKGILFVLSVTVVPDNDKTKELT